MLQVTLDFSLSEQVYAKAKVKDVTSVGLWLGADVMLDYPLEDAKKLLVLYCSNLDLLTRSCLASTVLDIISAQPGDTLSCLWQYAWR